MIRAIVFLVLLVYCSTSWSQTNYTNKLDLIQGIWEGTTNSDSESLYKIVSGNKSLGISCTDKSSVSNFYLLETIEGFQNYKYNEVDSINIKWLSEEGKYYTSILNEEKISKDGWIRIAYCIIPEYFECDGELMSINGGRLSEFVKTSKLPEFTIRLLFHKGVLDGRNYLKEYLNLNVLAIKSLKCTIYSKPDKPTNVRLSRNDVVVIIEEASKWLKVKYSESNIGWIKKEAVKQ